MVWKKRLFYLPLSRVLELKALPCPELFCLFKSFCGLQMSLSASDSVCLWWGKKGKKQAICDLICFFMSLLTISLSLSVSSTTPLLISFSSSPFFSPQTLSMCSLPGKGKISLESASLPTGLIELNCPLWFLVGIYVGSSSQPSVQKRACPVPTGSDIDSKFCWKDARIVRITYCWGGGQRKRRHFWIK